MTLGLLPSPEPWRAQGNHPHSLTAASAPSPGSWPSAGTGDRLLQRAGIIQQAHAAPHTATELMQRK